MTDPDLDALQIDPTTRPKAPKLGPVTDAQRAQGRHLAAIHQMHLRDLVQVHRLLDQVEAGATDPSALPERIRGLEMAENYRLAGSLCGRECYVLTMHHDIEEAQMFPHLASRGNAGLARVVERLREEHKAVHALLERLAVQAEALIDAPCPAALAPLRATYARLEEVVRSHFGYEESELEEALGLYGGL